MGRPKLTKAEVESRNAAIIASLGAGLSPAEAAREHGVDPSHASRLRRDAMKQLEDEDALIAEMQRNPPLPPWADGPCKERVLLRLASSASAAELSGGLFKTWITPALPYAFGEAFHLPEDDDRVPIAELVRVVQRWGCTLGHGGVWIAPRA